ncbi:hypothetical protein D3C71_1887260 [compost metagenome]
MRSISFVVMPGLMSGAIVRWHSATTWHALRMASISYLLFKIIMFVSGLLRNSSHSEFGDSIDVQVGIARIVVQPAAADQHGKHIVEAVVFVLGDRLEWNV